MAFAVAGQQQISSSRQKETALSALFKRPAILSVLLVLATVALYYPVHQHPFINYDDDEYFYENPQVLSGPHFNRVLTYNPDDAGSNLGIALYELQQGNFSDAVVHYQNVVKQPAGRFEDRQQSYLGMAKTYRALGERDKSDST